jgi:hypothetical protein
MRLQPAIARDKLTVEAIMPDSAIFSLLAQLAPTVLDALAPSLKKGLRQAVVAWQAKLPPARPIQEQIADVIRGYESQQLVVVLGAGISMHYHLPDWNTLLQTLLIGATTSGKPERQLIARLFNEVFRPSPLIAARYIRNHFRDEKASAGFEEAVRAALYDGVRIGENRSPLMRELCALILAPARSPMLDSVITYNFDDILERELDALGSQIGIEIPYRLIYAPTERPSERELPIYHVHGYLPSTGTLSELNAITLGEADYHQQYSRIYSWENTIQINKFADRQCLFIGTSFSDPNLRRLLDVAREQHQDVGIRHHMLKKRPSVAETTALLRRKLDERPDLVDEKVKAELAVEQVVTDLIQLETAFEETDARSFSVGIIWVDDYEDIADLLRSVRMRDPSFLAAGVSRAAEGTSPPEAHRAIVDAS